MEMHKPMSDVTENQIYPDDYLYLLWHKPAVDDPYEPTLFLPLGCLLQAWVRYCLAVCASPISRVATPALYSALTSPGRHCSTRRLYSRTRE